MTPAELRKLAGKAEDHAVAIARRTLGMVDPNRDTAETANRLFLMARNLRERAREIECDAAQKRAGELLEAHREAARIAEIARKI